MKRVFTILAALALVILCATFLPTESKAASVSNLTFTLNADGESYSVSTCNSSASGSMAIPATYNGKPVTGIGVGAFNNCTNLTNITIPDSVTSIGDYAFYYCLNLESILVAPNNPNYCSDSQGVLYNKDKTILIQAPDRITACVIPDSVLSIANSAFSECADLANLTLGKKVSIIGENAFSECVSLTNLTIPGSVTSIGDKAFAYCDSLKSVTYCGTARQWNQISIGTNNNALTNAQRNYHSWMDPTCTNPATCFACGDTTGDPIGHQKYVTTTSEETVTLYATLNSKTYPFSVSGNQITSTNKVNESSATYTITAKRAFTLELQYLVSSEEEYDVLTIKHNATTKAAASGTATSTFTSLSINMSAGDTVTITYSKDVIMSEGNDCAVVKIITPATQKVTVENKELVAITDSNRNSFASCAEDVFCDVCGEVAIPKVVDHEFVGGNCQTNMSCAVCGVKGALGSHNVVNGICTICKAYGTCGTGLTWTLDKQGTLTISGTGDMENYDGRTKYAPWYTIKGSVKRVVIAHGVTSIGDYAFELSNVTEVTIPASVTSIGYSAFTACYKLTSITVPASVTSIGDYAFYYCLNLESIQVDPDNPNYCSDSQGVLYNKDKTVLIQAPNKIVTCVIPESVINIGDSAFSACVELASLTIGKRVSVIGDNAFNECVSITHLTIPGSVKSIGDMAFAYCNNLSSVMYCGTAQQWNQISIGTNNNTLTNAQRSYHSWIEATCTTPEYCTVCGMTRDAALGHLLRITTEECKPTCTEDGYTAGFVCVQCDYVLEPAVAKALGHRFKDSVCTQCGATSALDQVDALNFDKIAFNLGAKIGVQFALNNNDLKVGGYQNAYVKVTMKVYNADGTYEMQEIILREGQTAGKYLVFIYGASPKLMGREMIVQAFAEKDGKEYCGASQIYSLKQGIMELLETYYPMITDSTQTVENSDKARKRAILLVDMLYYGAEAQIRFEQAAYDGLVTDGLDAKYAILRTTAEPEFNETSTEALKTENELYALSLGVADAVELQFTFGLAEGEHDKYAIKVICAGQVYMYTSKDFQYVYTNDPNRVTIVCGELAAKQMREVVMVALLKDGKQVSQTYTTSIESVATPMGTDETNKNYALARAMMTYGDSAKACFG